MADNANDGGSGAEKQDQSVLSQITSRLPSKEQVTAHLPTKDQVASYLPTKEQVSSYKDQVAAYMPSKEQMASYMPEGSMLASYLPIAPDVFRRQNPVAPADSDTRPSLIWLEDNTASQDPADPNVWHTTLSAAFFAPGTGDGLAHGVSHIAERLGLGKDEAAHKTIEARLTPWFEMIVPGKEATVRVGKKPQTVGRQAGDGAARVVNVGHISGNADAEVEKLIGPSNGNGISTNQLALNGQYKDGDLVTAYVPAPMTCVTAHTTFATPKGWAVVSDIDDTIKLTMTGSTSGILRTTFVDKPQPIRGMPELYRHLVEKLQGAPFWYLSASPYNLYPFLHDFRDQYYPAGTMRLRQDSWQSLAGFLSMFTTNTQKFKEEELTKLNKAFPGRRFVCFGDSTQSDPEAYGERYRQTPGWIAAIFIRKVTYAAELEDVLPGHGNEERNRPERFEKAFKDVPKDVWYVFEEPEEVYAHIDRLVASPAAGAS